MAYPVQLEVTSPLRFERLQLLMRLAILVALGWVGVSMGWVNGLLYLALPVIAAVAISSYGAAKYLDSTAPQLWRAVRWLLAFSAYMLLVTDRFPVSESDHVTIELQPTAKPTVADALMRLVTSLPSAIILGFLSCVSCVLMIAGVVMILIEERVPAGIIGFQTGILRWEARLFAYHASIVDEYPPFSFSDRNTPARATASQP